MSCQGNALQDKNLYAYDDLMELLVEKVKGYYSDKLRDKDNRDVQHAGRKASRRHTRHATRDTRHATRDFTDYHESCQAPFS